MARFTKQELLDSINVQAVNDIVTLSGSKLPSGQSSSMQDIREGVTDLLTFGLQSIGEAFRHLYDVSNAEAVMYQLNGEKHDGK